MTTLAAHNLTRRYGSLVALDDVSLEVAPGRVLALLGPNGAGKTTTIDLLSGSASPDAGQVSWDGSPATPPLLRRVVGFCPQTVGVWPRLTCSEQLVLLARLHGQRRTDARRRCHDLLDRLGLGGKAGARADTLSGGMQRRLNLALALVSDPPALLLDEPEAGLDPQGRALVRDFIAELAQGRAVLLASHDILEVERLAERVVVLDQGRVLATGSPEELLTRYELGDEVELTAPGDPGGLAAAVADRLAGDVRVTGRTVVARLPRGGLRLSGLLTGLEAAGHEVASVRSRPATLEDVFLTLTGRSLRE